MESDTVGAAAANPDEFTDVHQADVEQVERGEILDAAGTPVEPERISVQELINRMGAAANQFGNQSKTRLVLINAARALVELTHRLDAAEQEIERRNEEERPSPLIVLPGSTV
jgi:hypothetical protein